MFWAFIFYRIRTEFGSVTEFHYQMEHKVLGAGFQEWEGSGKISSEICPGVAGVLDRLLDEEFRKQTKMK